MASPATFPKVLNYAYGGMLTMYLLVAVFGYYVRSCRISTSHYDTSL